MGVPDRIKNYTGRYALVDDVPFKMPVATEKLTGINGCFFM